MTRVTTVLSLALAGLASGVFRVMFPWPRIMTEMAQLTSRCGVLRMVFGM